MPTRKEFVNKALEWAHPRTPFRHQGRVKGPKGGVDCVGLVICTGDALGLGVGAKDDIRSYSHVPDGRMFVTKANEYMVRQPYDPSKILAEQVRLASIIVFWIEDPRYPRHVGIVSKIENNLVTLLHSFTQLRGVVETRIDNYWLQRIVNIYEIPGIED